MEQDEGPRVEQKKEVVFMFFFVWAKKCDQFIGQTKVKFYVIIKIVSDPIHDFAFFRNKIL